MVNWRLMGELERAVMGYLWDAQEPQTGRQVHAALSAQRHLAYTTTMTVLRRLAAKGLALQDRQERAHRYLPLHSSAELVAGLMIDALDYVADARGREAALLQFVERVGSAEARALRCALGESDSKHVVPAEPHAAGIGIVAVTAVPEPGRDRMFNRPPTSSARSAIDNRP